MSGGLKLKLDRASVTVRTWGLEGGRGLFEMEFSFGSAFPPWVNRVVSAMSALCPVREQFQKYQFAVDGIALT
jgi:hypothetical protein